MFEEKIKGSIKELMKDPEISRLIVCNSKRSHTLVEKLRQAKQVEKESERTEICEELEQEFEYKCEEQVQYEDFEEFCRAYQQYLLGFWMGFE